MRKWSKYFDIFFLVLIGALFGLSGINHFNRGFILTINTYLGFLCWLLVVILKIRKPEKYQFFVAYLLIFSTLNVISFTAESIAFGLSRLVEYKGIFFTMISINPISFILVIIYFVGNSSILKQLYKKLFKPGDLEISDEYKKQVMFYYEKFNVLSIDEFEGIIKNLNDYPLEAQEAIKKIMDKRKVEA